ncbi:MAG: outer membrane protein assembly factor BamA [Desulfobulbaceae bacterium]|jgi:outer membrane protein insertion porin family|nr:outer membrane protein assembly factor BamA [Desulfobulbaceae bacterium]
MTLFSAAHRRGLLFLALLLFFVAGVAQAAEAPSGATVILPLKINASQNPRQLTDSADAAMREAAGDKPLALISRERAQSLVAYETGVWPPSQEQLRRVAAATGAGYIAVGSLTYLGGRYSLDVKLYDSLAPEGPTFYFREFTSPDRLLPEMEGLLGDVASYSGRESRIASIAPAGNVLIDAGAILKKIESKPGSPYNPAALREDLKAIAAMGYFDDVQIEATDGPDGKIVIFRVFEKPIIKTLKFTGLDAIKEEEIKKDIDVKENFVLNSGKLNEGAEKIKELYRAKGYYNTTVKVDVAYPDKNGAAVTFTVNEGKKVYVKDITFQGNNTFSAKQLRKEMDTSEKGFFSWLTDSGLLDRDKVKRDSDKIVAFYHNNGFLEARVSQPEIRQDGEWLFVSFAIDEGPRFAVGQVDCDGDLDVPGISKQKVLDLMTIRQEKYMSSKTVRDNVMAINDLYAEHGYAFSDITPGLRKSAAEQRADLTLHINKGELTYVNRIIIKGNTRTRDNVIRRELTVYEGNVFNSKALRESSQNLQKLQYFEQVNITPEPATEANRMNVIIEVKERSTGSFSIGAGYSSVDNVILMGQIAENNFMGRGDKVQLSANIGGSSNRFNLGYTNPHLYDTELSWGADLFKTMREYDDYTRDSKGGGLRIGYPIWEKWRIYGTYSFTDNELSDIMPDASYIIRNSVDLQVTSAVKTSLVRDTRNRYYGASEGSKQQVSVEYAGGPFGGDSQFTKLEGSTSWFFPVVWGTVFHFEASAGQAFENEDGKLPVYERFYLGGMNTIRGFEYAKVSPIDQASGDRIGGDKMWYSNFEYIFPIVESQGLHALVFYDIGQVLNDDEDWGFSDPVSAVGVGMRWLSPLGPLSVVWGFNLDPRDDEDESVWDFSVGGVF